MKLTNANAWHVAAGGTYAAPDKNSYTAITDIGEYRISPISAVANSNKHIGYRVHFVNVLGKLPGGLWNQLHQLTDLPNARSICQMHMEKNNGTVSVPSIPGNGAKIKEGKKPVRVDTITLDRFCAIFLNPESVSTNRLHKIMLAHSAMEVVSHMLTEHQFKLCMQFIGNGFNPSCLDNSTVEIEIATDLNVD